MDPHNIIKKCIQLFRNKNGSEDFVYLVVELDEYTIHFLNNGDMKYIEENNETDFELDGDINNFVDTFEDIFSVFLIDTLIDDTEFLHETYIQNQEIFFGCVDKYIITKHELLVSIENQVIIKSQLNLIKEYQTRLLREQELLNQEKAVRVPGVSQKELNDLIVSNVSRNFSFGEILDETAKDIIDEPYYHHCENELSLNTELYFLLEKRIISNKNEKLRLGLSGDLIDETNNLVIEINRIINERAIISGTNMYKTEINEQQAETFRKISSVCKTLDTSNRDLYKFGKSFLNDIIYLKRLKY
jgi:hypothetical protein